MDAAMFDIFGYNATTPVEQASLSSPRVSSFKAAPLVDYTARRYKSASCLTEETILRQATIDLCGCSEGAEACSPAKILAASGALKVHCFVVLKNAFDKGKLRRLANCFLLDLDVVLEKLKCAGIDIENPDASEKQPNLHYRREMSIISLLVGLMSCLEYSETSKGLIFRAVICFRLEFH